MNTIPQPIEKKFKRTSLILVLAVLLTPTWSKAQHSNGQWSAVYSEWKGEIGDTVWSNSSSMVKTKVEKNYVRIYDDRRGVTKKLYLDSVLTDDTLYGCRHSIYFGRASDLPGETLIELINVEPRYFLLYHYDIKIIAYNKTNGWAYTFVDPTVKRNTNVSYYAQQIYFSKPGRTDSINVKRDSLLSHLQIDYERGKGQIEWSNGDKHTITMDKTMRNITGAVADTKEWLGTWDGVPATISFRLLHPMAAIGWNEDAELEMKTQYNWVRVIMVIMKKDKKL